MRTIIKVEGVEEKRKDNEIYYKTYAVVDDGTECVGFGKDFKVNDLVEVFLDYRYDEVKMRHSPRNNLS